MIDRNISRTSRTVAATLAAAALLLAAASAANAAHAVHSPTAGVSTTQPARATPNWGYGRGWCYWHPYSCHRY